MALGHCQDNHPSRSFNTSGILVQSYYGWGVTGRNVIFSPASGTSAEAPPFLSFPPTDSAPPPPSKPPPALPSQSQPQQGPTSAAVYYATLALSSPPQSEQGGGGEGSRGTPQLVGVIVGIIGGIAILSASVLFLVWRRRTRYERVMFG